MFIPEEAHEAQSLGQGVVDLVLRVPVVHLLPFGQGRLLKQLHHLHGPGVRGPHHLPKYPGTKPSHAHGVTGQGRHRCTTQSGTSLSKPANFYFFEMYITVKATSSYNNG
uniref:Uncharacterized protein n=1 Tax=Anguilla anguilla TaxID=7936 RepID=A0A0E9WWU3_ANGAN